MRLLDRAAGRLPRPWRTGLDWALTIVVAVAFVLVFEAEVAKPFRVPSSSMEPTLHCARPAGGCEARFSDRVLACEICFRFSAPARGQIVVFHAPAAAAGACETGGVYVKRVIGLPGDTLREDMHAAIWVNGRRLDEPYIPDASRLSDTSFRGRTWHVPADSYFMLGDNRGNSCDSRSWGAVRSSRLIGPVVLTYWPPTRLAVGR